ncbi:MAG: XRE family transcriptional regulator [Bdellovibrionaceae bacterium]|nr:XRE family transcriptional regulator [Bdellovibrionales bacterium]MCB9086682.1 XRE family transcriptional regulator [Pseudobdellovibrionaceae bacterium]
MSNTRFPSDTELKEMREKLSKGPASKPLPKDATPVDKIKFQICKEFVIYKNAHTITQKALAEKIGTDEALISKILHYQIEEFTIDRLIKFLSTLYPDAKVKIEVA